MSGEVKQRKRTQKPSDEPASIRDEEQKNSTVMANKTSGLDLKTIISVFCLATCAALSWLVLQQNERLSKIEETYSFLHGKTFNLVEMEEEVVKVSKKSEGVRLAMEGLGAQRGAVQAQLRSLELDVGRLKEWGSGLTEERAQLQRSLDALTNAVAQIKERTSAISNDFANKVASVRTDVRRMEGLRSELESLLAQMAELEDRTAQVERSMVKRIGDLLASSIDRVSNLRASSERNTQALEQLRRRVPELAAADEQISERLRELEGGRARLLRTLTFASDLKPKVAAIKRDFGALDPQLSDLTLRIGRLAEDLTKREREIGEIRHTLANLTAVEGDLSVTSRQVGEIDLSEMAEKQQAT